MNDCHDLIQGAESLLLHDPMSIAHRRGAAFIARQAIELAVRSALGGAEQSGMKWASRFLVLGVVRPDAAAERGRVMWERWSEVCHYHHYDLVPSAAAVQERLLETQRWIDGLGLAS